MIVSYSQQRIHEYFIIKTKCININFSLKNTNFVTQYIFYSFRKKITGTTTKGGGGKNCYIFLLLLIKKKTSNQVNICTSHHLSNSTTSRDLRQVNVCLTCIFYLCNLDNYKHLSDTSRGEKNPNGESYSRILVTSNFLPAHFKPHFSHHVINARNSHREFYICFLFILCFTVCTSHSCYQFFFSQSANVWYTQPHIVGLIKQALRPKQQEFIIPFFSHPNLW